MKHFMHLLTHIYQRLLRLYPASFRHTFAGEMAAVFTLTVKDTHGWLPLLRLIMREAFSLPTSLIRAHWHEYNRSTTLAYHRGTMMTSHPSARLFRWTISGSLVLAIVFAFLVILPYFTLGMHLQPTDMVVSGRFDPKGFSLYSDTPQSENVLYVLTITVALIAPFVGIVLSIVSGVRLLKHWRSLSLKQHLMGGAALLTSASLLLFVLSPFGRILYLWMMD